MRAAPRSSAVARLAAKDDGATLMEYALIAALATVITIIAVMALMSEIT